MISNFALLMIFFVVLSVCVAVYLFLKKVAHTEIVDLNDKSHFPNLVLGEPPIVYLVIVDSDDRLLSTTQITVDKTRPAKKGFPQIGPFTVVPIADGSPHIAKIISNGQDFIHLNAEELNIHDKFLRKDKPMTVRIGE